MLELELELVLMKGSNDLQSRNLQLIRLLSCP
jgi:hypothetical protein